MSNINFRNIPASGIFAPGTYIEFDPSKGGFGQAPRRALVIGQTINAVAAVPTFVASGAQAQALCGIASGVARAASTWKANNQDIETWVLPLADNGSGTAATGTIAFTGPATENRTLPLYIAGRSVPVTVTSGMTATQLATAVVAACATVPDLPVSAASSTGTVTFTALNKGTLGNFIDIRFAYYGLRGGEQMPAGISATITAMASGATDPVLTGIAALLGDMLFDYIIWPYGASGALTTLKSMMNDSSGRWAYNRQDWGHAFAPEFGTGSSGPATFTSGLVASNPGQNDQHTTLPALFNSPNPPEEVLAGTVAACAGIFRDDPNRPLSGVVVQGVLAPAMSDMFDWNTRNTLLANGFGTYRRGAGGVLLVDRLPVSYLLNSSGIQDRVYFDTGYLYALMLVARTLRGVVPDGSKIADDGTRLKPGSNTLTPSSIRGLCIAAYAGLVDAEVCDRETDFAANLIVQRNTSDPFRCDILYPPYVIPGLQVIAALVQPRQG